MILQLWIAIVLLITPEGRIISVHNPTPFKDYQTCIEYVTKQNASVPKDNLITGFCVNAIPSEEI